MRGELGRVIKSTEHIILSFYYSLFTRVLSLDWNLVALDFKRGRIVAASRCYRRILHRDQRQIWSESERWRREEERERERERGGRDRTVEAGTSLKCQRHHNSRGAKERLLAVLEPAKKPARRSQEEEEEQIKIASTFRPLPTLRARVFTLEGKTED